ncbi:divergent polysaccharide deacetylase family protein [Roseobacteraceae bacterium NS-SX3]
MSLGTLAALAGAAVWSLSTPLPQVVDVAAEDPGTPAGPVSPEPAAAPESAPSRDADLVEAAPAAPDRAPGGDTSPLPEADLSPAGRPEVGEIGTVPSAAPPVQAEAPGIAFETGARPAPPVDTAAAPGAPAREQGPEVSDEPAPPPPADPAVELDQAETAGLADAAGAEAPGETQPQPGGEMAEAGAAAPQPAPGDTAGPAPAPQVSTDVPVFEAPQIGKPPAATAPPVARGAVVRPVPDRAAAQEPQAAGGEQVAVLEDTGDAADGPAIGTPAVPLTERRQDTAQDTGAAPAANPFSAHAEPFENPEGRPLMSIVLIDGEDSIGAEALADFPYPLTFAIDPAAPRAREKMEARRAAGFEVLILADLPREAAPQDAETALDVWFRTLPEAVGVLEGVETGFQGNRPLAEQVADAAASTGHGLVMQDSGLNTVQKLALRDGVPAGVVFRDFDGAGQDPRAIRRFLDQAAFRAGQEGAVIMLGRLQPGTISALLLWGLQDRAARVALAPVSASLDAQLPGK